MRKTAVVLGLLALSACAPAPQSTPTLQATQLGIAGEGGFVDLTFGIKAVDCPNPEGDCVITAGSEYRGSSVGLAIAVRGGMKPGIKGAEIDRAGFMRDGIVFSSVGPESDRLLATMASLYDIKVPGGRFAPRVAATSFALGGDPAKIQTEPLKFKVFFNDAGGEDEYAELYVNIDLRKHSVELAEKDPEYRNAVVRALWAAP
jgi:hypothetical protein